MALVVLQVRGRSRVPSPPTRITAFIAFLLSAFKKSYIAILSLSSRGKLLTFKTRCINLQKDILTDYRA
jgi:tRNA(His) 5'-end guanylyltransferase